MKASKNNSVLVLIIISLFFPVRLNAQSGWILQPSPGMYSFSKIKFINSQTGFLIGYTNKIFKTTNTGGSWTEFNVSDSVNDLRDIFFVNQNTGYIAGGSVSIHPPDPLFVTSLILKTTDAGDSWFKVYYDTGQNVQKHFSVISFIDENTGYAGGGLYATGQNYLFKTTDAGNNWHELSYTQNGFPMAMRFFSQTDAVTALFFFGIMKTSNSGNSWMSTYYYDICRVSFF